MRGAEFMVPTGVRQVLLSTGRPTLLVDPHRWTWLPWGRRLGEPGAWPEGGVVRWEALYRPTWSRWAPQKLLLWPRRWMADSGLWVDLPPGWAILAVKLSKAPGPPVYVVTLDQGAPKLVPRMLNRPVKEVEFSMACHRDALQRAHMDSLDHAMRSSMPFAEAPPRAPPAPGPPFDWESAGPDNEPFLRWVRSGERITGLILGCTAYRRGGHRFAVYSGLSGLPGGPFWCFPLPERFGEDPSQAVLALRAELRLG